ncbi:DJ-1/PfpI family protein [Pedobacter sp. Leaf170]|uniref:DJ-1/PfpI family protein n=1 Tax=Pedobacter sp. Leaf170 TaxID=2876558 RepID=UPI001E5BA4F5|nr:DJ-1/PfpI family protein [Pedobacter sp. Leaf170]
MKQVSILVPESSVLQAIADPQYLFCAVNEFMIINGKKPLFEVKLIGLKRSVTLNEGLYTVNTHQLLQDVNKTDLVIIPALFGDMKSAVAKNQEMLPWIINQYKDGAEIASLCVGAFLLASTGLLDGKRCSTHWGFQNQLRQMFPSVKVVSGSIIVYNAGHWATHFAA